MNKTVIIESCKYLSDVIKQLPSHCLINKGITGCGGTTLELESKRDSIILCPTRNLVTSKSSLGYFGVDGNITKTEIKNYVMKEKGYKKIVATYDALEKIMETIINYKDYFLLIDEYHLLFNDYSFRSKPIRFILKHFMDFNNWAFMTATPLKEEFILKELKNVDQITYEWKNSVPVRMTIKDTYFVQKELINLIESASPNKNLHIFINSVSTISKVVQKLDCDYRVVCSENSKTKIKNFAKITDPIKKLNFYTSCAFEGCLLPEEKVLTDKGLKNAKDVTLEDKLVNKDGNYVNIKNLQQYEKQQENVFTLTMGNTFRTTTFTGKHPILISEHPLKDSFKYTQCKKIKEKQWTIYPNLYRKENVINLQDWEIFKSNSSKELINPLTLEDFWWFIGLYLGDGWTQNDGYRVFITVNKKELSTIERLENFCRLINRNFLVKDSSENCVEYIINCKQLVDYLNNNFGKYSYGKRIPEKYKYIPHNLKISLLNGYLDSDGCILFSNNSYRASFVSINLELLEDFQDIITSLGIKSSLKKLRNSEEMSIEGRIVNCKETYDLNISHNDLLKFYNLCPNKNYQKLQKLNFTEELKNKRNPRFVNMDFSEDFNYVYFKIKTIKTKKYTGSVYNYECDTHSYVCRHITTHNCDICDENGICVIVCDTNISSSMLDIATKIRQVCGRLRDSKYKDECYLILNTNKHRYAGTSRKEFEDIVKEGEDRGKLKEIDIKNKNDYERETEFKLYNPETYYNLYLNKDDGGIFFDENLKKLDIYNYNLINEIYSSTISVLSELNNNNFVAKVETTENKKGLSFIREMLEDREYTYEELENIFSPIFKEHKMKWNKKTSIKNYFPSFTKKKKMVNKIRDTYYKFIL